LRILRPQEVRVGRLLTKSRFDLRQDDTFFACSQGRLKLRAFASEAGELIVYRRPDIEGSKMCVRLLVPHDARGEHRMEELAKTERGDELVKFRHVVRHEHVSPSATLELFEHGHDIIEHRVSACVEGVISNGGEYIAASRQRARNRQPTSLHILGRLTRVPSKSHQMVPAVILLPTFRRQAG
jgi:hypothetical protein